MTMSSESSSSVDQVVVGWYSPRQWDRLLEIADDPANLGQSYTDWRRRADAAYRELRSQGTAVTKIRIDVEDLLQWCDEQAIPVNAESRTRYAAFLVRFRPVP
nr:putative integron gene cassette protein [uncultured bacterium]CAP47598.1 putative integron gene cassette protein [uncultured bacterium]